MSNIIIGTAGHIDHGKSTLIKRLSNIDPDRLKEEKKRGITIELGFAYFDLDSGKRVGIVDVPGHEKFIKHMLAGAGGIDLVLLVVSADEGMMPQTREHLDILNLLGIEKGIICLTKCDLVDDEWREMVKLEILEEVKNTFLKDANIIEIGFNDEAGLTNLKNHIEELSASLKPKNSNGSPRIWVDRVFSITGFGTVVTGTLLEGKISVGDKLELYPKGLEARIRNIQVHSEDVKTAYAGQRVAINIANLAKDDISRGDVLAEAGAMKSAYIIDANVSLLENSPRELYNWARVRLYSGSKEVLARIVLLDREELKQGEECFAQLRLEEEIALKYNDKFVMRFYSPLETIGGGIVLDSNAKKHKRFREDIIEELVSKNSGDQSLIVDDIIYKDSDKLIDIAYLLEKTGFEKDKLSEILDKLVAEGTVIVIDKKYYIHTGFIDSMNDEAVKLLLTFYNDNPLKIGISKDELRNKLFGKIKPKLFDEIMINVFNLENLEEKNGIILIRGREIEYDSKQEKIKNSLIKYYDEAGLNPENLNIVQEKLGIKKQDRDVYESLVGSGELVRLNDNINVSKKHFGNAKQMLIDEIEKSGEITLATYRDLTASSRKIAVALLDYFDKIGLTKRIEDVRKLV